MKPTRLIVSAALLGALLVPGPEAALRAGESKRNGSGRGGNAAEHMSEKGSANNNAQWSADPEKGWVRAEDRHKMHQQNKSSSELQSGKSKGKRKK